MDRAQRDQRLIGVETNTVMMSVPSVASVTVSHNAQAILPRQMSALLRQSRPLQEIIVVDNHSSDRTCEMLGEKYPHVTRLRLPSNLGVGGGYAAGLEYAAREKGHDWVWLLDDDSVPGDDGLENLLKALDFPECAGGDMGVLAPVPVEPGSQLACPGLLWRNGWIEPAFDVSQQAVLLVDAVISSGSLIGREVVEKVGLPRADFFMDFVDYEYCLRIRSHGYKIAMVAGSLLNHTVGNVRTVKFLWHSRTRVDNAPWREYYLSRNQTFTIWNHYPDWQNKFFIIRCLLRHAAGIVAFGKEKRACLGMILTGFMDGRAGKLGIRYQPND